MKRKGKAPEAPGYPRSFEVFGRPYLGGAETANREPSCWNGVVSIDKYRITIEKVEEPIEDVRERLRKLWRQNEYNHHHTHPMNEAARKLGFELDPKERAVDFERRNATVDR